MHKLLLIGLVGLLLVASPHGVRSEPLKNAIPDERTAVAVALDIYNGMKLRRAGPIRFEDVYPGVLTATLYHDPKAGDVWSVQVDPHLCDDAKGPIGGCALFGMALRKSDGAVIDFMNLS